MSSGLMTPPQLGGWTRSELIELADRRTERRGSKTLDLNSEFIQALQTLCSETRWAWRRKTSIFTLEAGVWQYDLSQVFPYPSPNAYTSQPTWQFSYAQRAGGFLYLLFPPGTALPPMSVGDSVYVLSEGAPQLSSGFAGPVVITQPGADNVVSNGDFESGLTGLDGWIGNNLGFVSVPVHGGVQALELIGDIQATVSQPTGGFLLTPGVAVTISAWIYLAQYAGASPVDATVVTFDATGNVVAVHPASANTSIIGAWQNVTLTFTPGTNEITGAVYLQINSQFSSTAQGLVTAYFDDVSVQQSGTEFVVNGGFEGPTTVNDWVRSGVSTVTAPVHGGGRALQLSSAEAQMGIEQPVAIPLTAGVPVRLTGWVYLAQYAGNMSVGLSLFTEDALGNNVNFRNAYADPTKIGVWQKVELIFTPLPNEITGFFMCVINSGAGTPGKVTAIFDDLSVSIAVVGTQDGYDLIYNGSSRDVMGLMPFPYIVPINARDFHQMVKHGFRIYPNPAAPQSNGELTPLFERERQTAAIYVNNYVPLPGMPSQYFMMPGAFLVLCVTPVPDKNYPVSIDYWCIPNVAPDSMPEQIPLVPAFMHHVLLKRLEAQIFRYTLGEGAAKYQAAMAEYTALVSRFQGMDGMVSGEHSDYSADDDYNNSYTTGASAVQSTV